MDEAQTHNQRIVQSGAVQMARSAEELVEGINEALESPEMHKEARKTIVEQECGPFPGQRVNIFPITLFKWLTVEIFETRY